MPAPRSTTGTTRQSNSTAPSKFSPLSMRCAPADRSVNDEVPRRVRHPVPRHPHDGGRRHGRLARMAALEFRVEPAAVRRGTVGLQRSLAAGPLHQSATSWNVRLNRTGGAYQFNYDMMRGSFLQQRMMAYYNAQCCGFAVEYQPYDLSGSDTTADAERQPPEFLVYTGRASAHSPISSAPWAAARALSDIGAVARGITSKRLTHD